MALYRILGSTELSPSVHASAYVAESADVIGDVRLAENTSIWSHVTLRGDNEPITIGARSNVQESSVLHTDIGFPLVIGENVTVGHQAMLHGCTVKDGALIGIQAGTALYVDRSARYKHDLVRIDAPKKESE